MLKFGADYARRLRRCAGRHGDTWHLDEVFCKINGELVYLWRGVDQDGDTLEVLAQKRRNAKAARRFLRQLLERLGYASGRSSPTSFQATRQRAVRFCRWSNTAEADG